MPNKYLTLDKGEKKLIEAIKVSTGNKDAGKIPALNENGKLDVTLLPDISITPDIARASEALSSGDFINLFNNDGVLSARLADNSNGRNADGFVTKAASVGEDIAVSPLGGVNTNVIGLTTGVRVYLGTAGKTILTPLDENESQNKGFLSQFLGKAKSSTEILTVQEDYIVL